MQDFNSYLGFLTRYFHKYYSRSVLILLSILLCGLLSCTRTENKFVKTESDLSIRGLKTTCFDHRNSPDKIKKPIVVLVSIDGFRPDYIEMYSPPNLIKIAQSGVRSVGMIPSFPSLTFPNHVSLITGLFPGHHGIVSNKFYDKNRKTFYSMSDPDTVNDSTWYSGETLWGRIQQSGMNSNVLFWVGSEAKIGGVHPNCFAQYMNGIPNEERVDKVIEWLSQDSSKIPHFVGLYFSVVDSKGHEFGPGSKEVGEAVLEIDGLMGKLNSFIEKSKLPINLILVSDHGMENINKQEPIIISDYTDTSKFKVGDRGAVMMMYADDPSITEKAYTDIKTNEKNFKIYRRVDVPAEFSFQDKDKVGDLVIIADPTYYIIDKTFSKVPPSAKTNANAEKPAVPIINNKATHGWTFHNKNMQALFIAKGPQIKKLGLIGSFNNVDVYPFVLNILGLEIPDNIDGNSKSLEMILK